MHHLATSGPATVSDLEVLFARQAMKSLDSLEEASMVRHIRNKWVAQPLSKVFAARHIIAIEAKVKRVRDALDQAHLNTWFASSSFIVVPHIVKDSQLLAKASELGLGVWALDGAVIDPSVFPTQRLPMSYASWQFNEWAWRAVQPPPSPVRPMIHAG